MPPVTVKTSGQRPRFRNIHVFDLRHYRLPAAGIVSILHRVSGALMFLLLPFVLWLFDTSLASEVSFESFRAAFVIGIGVVPAWLVKLVVWALVWAYLHHFIAGVRHLWMDMTHAVSVDAGAKSAWFTLASSVLLTLALGAKLFGLF
jgi:succinate dehydrogenase / fumarate reductase cytochrome b subunit